MSAASPAIGVIGGSGFTNLHGFELQQTDEINTPYGKPSSAITRGRINGREVVFIARHGSDHSIAPHQINYRANLWALKHSGVEVVIATATVGGIDKECRPGAILVPDQILDYTYSRQHTFSPLNGDLFHIDFTQPYCGSLRSLIIQSAAELGVGIVHPATYAATQGPRFESAAEVTRLERDGAHIVGMTGMPETSLAREIGLCYAALALVVNYAAGRYSAQIDVNEIRHAYQQSADQVHNILSATVSKLGNFECHLPPMIRP